MTLLLSKPLKAGEVAHVTALVTDESKNDGKPITVEIALCDKDGTILNRAMITSTVDVTDVREGQSSSPFKVKIGTPRPNPATSMVYCPYWLERGQDVTIELVDALGNRVAVLESGYHPEGEGRMHVDVSKYPQGHYRLRILSPDGAATQSVLIVR
jgi:hypothetical protein